MLIESHKAVQWCGRGGLEEELVKIFGPDEVDDYWSELCDMNPPNNGTYVTFYPDEDSEIEMKIKELMGEADLIGYFW